MNTTWTFKTIDQGEVVAERGGLSRQEAADAIYAVMDGSPLPPRRANAEATSDEAPRTGRDLVAA